MLNILDILLHKFQCKIIFTNLSLMMNEQKIFKQIRTLPGSLFSRGDHSTTQAHWVKGILTDVE